MNDIEEYIFKDLKIQYDTIYIHPNAGNLTDRKRKFFAWIAQVQKYYQRNPVRFIQDAFGCYPFDAQKLIIQAAWVTPNVLLNCTRGFGKALDEDTPILTTKGFKKLKDLQIGDEVYGMDGLVHTVIEISETWYNDCYEVQFESGGSITCNEEHLWTLTDRLVSAKNLAEMKMPVTIPLCEPLNFEKKELPVDPYILGLWVASTNRADNSFVVLKKDIDEIACKIAQRGYQPFYRDSNVKRRDSISVYLPDGTSLYEKLLTIKNLDDYILSDIEDRKALLEGIIDANGIIYKDDCILFKAGHVYDEFGFLLQSLGVPFTTSAADKEYRFSISKDFVDPIERIHNTLPETVERTNKIVKIKKVKNVPTRCIQAANDGNFLCGTDLHVTHNSTMISLILMAKGMLFNNYWTYIASGTADQAITTFQTLERLANDNIDSFQGSTGYIFKQELERPTAKDTGFTHQPGKHRYKLYNGSETQTLTSAIDKNRGKRGSVVFDECGWLSAEMLRVFEAYAVVEKGFKTGTNSSGKEIGGLEEMVQPREMPYQKFYISSASDTKSEYFKLYCYFAKRMIMGDTDYFVAEFPYQVAINPYQNGVKMRNSLLNEATVTEAMSDNPERAMREYYCQFIKDVGDDAIISRAEIVRNSVIRAPLLYNDTGDKKFIISYDPARMTDNSVILVSEIFQDKGRYKLRLVNCINLVETNSSQKKKTPKDLYEQVDILRQTILDYNLGGDNKYSNIAAIYLDGGSGGQAPYIMDALAREWTDKKGIRHPGLIDPERMPDFRRKFPEAVKDKLKILEPIKYKTEIFEDLIMAVSYDQIEFTADYDNKGELIIVDPDSETKRIILDRSQEAALVNFDMMKDQISNMIRIPKENGKDNFEIAPDKAIYYPHDDHAYTLALAAHGLKEYQQNRERKHKSEIKGESLVNLLSSCFKTGKIT